ncbi:MAG: tetratricopeptide repeat protein [Polaromonas sp.]|nr:tetratricopeptide repeat protein [Polaromonas sp.]
MSENVQQQIALAECHRRSGRGEMAEAILRQVVDRGDAPSKAFELLAYVVGNKGELQACEEFLRKACVLPQCSAEALFYLGRVQLQRDQPRDAVRSFEHSIKRAGEYFEALHELGVAHSALDEHDRALACFQQAERKNPNAPHLLANMGNTLATLERTGEAVHCYDRALALDPKLVCAWSDRGLALAALGRTQEALASYDRALALAPDDVATWRNRAITFLRLKRPADALHAYENVVRLAPDTDYLHGYLLHARMHLCRWDDWSQHVADTVARVRSGAKAAPPLALMAAPVDSATLLACARTYARDHCPPGTEAYRFKPARAGEKLRIGYFSSDFRNHPTAQLIARLFECHDRSRFECFGFSFGTPARDEMKERIHAALDHFMHVADRSDAQIAALARAKGIHIAVDLNGFTEGARPRIFSHRAAPMQVNFLGFPGSMGCEFIDYIVADATLIRPDYYAHYAEKVVVLPGAYQPNDDTKRISEALPCRERLGLPLDAFVFACFNNNYKITSDVFDVWMRLLLGAPGSVLWLLKGNAEAAEALKARAQARGVEPGRIVWADRVPLADHLARHAHADLCLDTFHYNAHTTCSDALWAGLPVLTLEGQTFASRVCASLLRAVGLPELVASSEAQYEAVALALAWSPRQLAGIRERLRVNRTAMPLFDTPRYARNIEAAFEAMCERYRQGLPPDHIVVTEQATTS